MKIAKTISKRTFQKDGKWVRKPVRTEILVCTCGSKYIKTKDRQTMCLRCTYYGPIPAPKVK